MQYKPEYALISRLTTTGHNMKSTTIPRPLHWILISVLFAVSSNGWAARWYSVEVILFEHLDDDGLQSEYWEANPGLPDYQHTSNRIGISTLSAQAFPAQPYGMIAYGNRRLQRQYVSLKTDRRYRPIFFKSWTMPVQHNRKKQTIYVEIPEQSAQGANNTPILEGTLKITIGRFLHVHTDFLYHREVKIPVLDSPVATNIGTAETSETEQQPTYITESRSFRVRGHRRMRSKKIHYMDHPALGMFVVFHPIKTRSSIEVPNPLANLKEDNGVEENAAPTTEGQNEN